VGDGDVSIVNRMQCGWKSKINRAKTAQHTYQPIKTLLCSQNWVNWRDIHMMANYGRQTKINRATTAHHTVAHKQCCAVMAKANGRDRQCCRKEVAVWPVD